MLKGFVAIFGDLLFCHIENIPDRFLGSLLNNIRVLNTVHTTHKSVKSYSVISLLQNGLGDIDR